MHLTTAPFRALLLTAVVGTCLSFITGCSREDRAEASAKTSNAVADTKEALANAWDKVRGTTYDKRDDFIANSKAVNARMDAQISELRANYSDAKASASRREAMAELKSSETDYHEKLDALGSASADTWDSAKRNVIASWDKLQASYYKARAD